MTRAWQGQVGEARGQRLAGADHGGLNCRKNTGFITETTGILKGCKWESNNQMCMWKTAQKVDRRIGQGLK